MRGDRDAIVVGAGPNGLAAASALARAGMRVRVLEALDSPGGGVRSAALTLPGFVHDVCSAVHPLAVASPAFRELGVTARVEWAHPEFPVAHPLDGGRAAVVERSVDATAARLGADASAYRRTFGALARSWSALAADVLGPLRWPHRPVLMARFGLDGVRSARGLAESRFRSEEARALFAGHAAHSMLPLERAPSAAFGLVLGALAHAVGWPIPIGGSQRITDALVEVLRESGGRIELRTRVDDVSTLDAADAVLLDLTPKEALRVAGDRFPDPYRDALRDYRYGPGVFKIDWALDGAIPWDAAECRRAGTVHVGGTLDELAASERAAWEGHVAERPFVLLSQPTLVDRTRAPRGKHVAWAYCHVPHGGDVDMTRRIEAQVERFAPGFRDLVLARHTKNARDVERENPNFVGGDINGGAQDLRQLFTRPVARLDPYSTPAQGIWLCSSATPPGGGVHGMSGWHAARSVLRSLDRP